MSETLKVSEISERDVLLDTAILVDKSERFEGLHYSAEVGGDTMRVVVEDEEGNTRTFEFSFVGEV